MREFRLFAKTKTKEQRLRIMARMMGHVRSVQNNLARTLEGLKPRVQGYSKVAFARVQKIHEVMKRLLPQIQYWHRTGWVAANKIISLTMPKLYSIPRGKVGKSLEFGLSWGITRLKGGFVLAHLAANKRELVDARYVIRSVEECRRLFGRTPTAYAYDRAGHSGANIAKLRELGVRHIGLAPRGRTVWEVSEAMKRRLVSERVRVEGSIGTLKSRRYGFNRPRASVRRHDGRLRSAKRCLG